MSAGLLQYANAMFVDDPQAPLERLARNGVGESGQESKNVVSSGSPWSENDEARVVARLVGPDVGEVEIQGDQRPPLAARELGNHRIPDPGGDLIEQMDRVMPSSSQHLHRSSREILVKLEFHAASEPGMSMTRARANSAAYAMAAGMASARSDG